MRADGRDGLQLHQQQRRVVGRPSPGVAPQVPLQRGQQPPGAVALLPARQFLHSPRQRVAHPLAVAGLAHPVGVQQQPVAGPQRQRLAGAPAAGQLQQAQRWELQHRLDAGGPAVPQQQRGRMPAVHDLGRPVALGQPDQQGGHEALRTAQTVAHQRIQPHRHRGQRRFAPRQLPEGAQHVGRPAHRLQALAADITDDQPGAERGGQHVVQVAADLGGGVGGQVAHLGAQVAQPLGHRPQQRLLHRLGDAAQLGQFPVAAGHRAGPQPGGDGHCRGRRGQRRGVPPVQYRQGRRRPQCRGPRRHLPHSAPIRFEPPTGRSMRRMVVK